MTDLLLGRTLTGDDVRLPLNALLRHAVCLGSAGSGKTVTCKVLCEEFIRQGIPVIAVDPQGDIASLGLLGDEAETVSRGTAAEVRSSYAAKLEMVVWTPGSTLGVPLSVNPLAGGRGPVEGATDEDVLRERGFAAEALADLANFDLRSSEGRAVTTLFGLVMEHVEQAGHPLDGVGALVRLLEAMPVELRNRVSSVVDEKLIEEVVRRTRMLNMGTQSLLLTGGVPLDIDLLLGRGSGASAVAAGKTRLSVIYLNTLGSEREKQFFVGQLAQAIYRWMLKHPSATPQALFYIDEVAPYIPPVRKPVCKDALSLLFRQARKYGVCCLAATQSAGDIDYKVLGQASTWSLGRMIMKQDVKKVESQLKSLTPEAAEVITRKLPSLNAGQSVLISPDVFPTPVELQTRWLVSKHKTLDETGIAAATDRELRQRLEQASKAEATPDSDAAAPDATPSGLAAGKSEIAVLAVTGDGVGMVGSCEIAVRGGGSGKITALGGQTKVSKESIKVAWEAASQLQAELDLPRNFARRYDVTVLDTRLAVKKDGPSAGLAYLAGIVAAFRGTAPRADLAMTGEITILGKVLAVGGIEEKVRAAYAAGYATVLIPGENRSDAAQLPADLRQAIEIVPVASVQEALPVIFAAPRRSKPEPPAKPLTTVPTATLIPTATLLAPGDGPPPAATVAEPAAAPGVEERIRDLLQREPGAYTFAEIAEKLAVSPSTVTRVGKQLAESGVLKSVKRGRATAYYLASLNLRPEYGLFGQVEAVKLTVLEPEARQLAGKQLASSYLVFAREEIVSNRLAYLPLYKVRFSAMVSEGWVFKHDVEKRDNLYFSGVTAELLSYTSAGFAFTADVPTNPVEVVDLDNLATFESRAPGDLPMDDAEMQALVEPSVIENSARQKFKLTVLGISLIFFPVWRFLIRDKESTSERDLCIDGLKGQPMTLNRPQAAQKRK
jgi:DNA-binding transcriptional ArsR family regulator